MEYEKQVAHLAKLAMTPGWWQYARQRAQELEADMPGIVASVRERIAEAGFKSAPEERGEWWK